MSIEIARAATRVAKLQAEIEAIDEERAALSEQLVKAEEKRLELQREAEEACAEKNRLIEEREKLMAKAAKEEKQAAAKAAAAAAKSSKGRGKRPADKEPQADADPAAKVPRGREKAPTEEAQDEEVAATKAPRSKDTKAPAPSPKQKSPPVKAPKAPATKAPASKSPAAKKPTAAATSSAPPRGAPAGLDADAGSVIDGTIIVPTHAQALAANSDDGHFCPTFMTRVFRAKKLDAFAAEAPVVPGSAGASRLAYLVSTNDACASGFDGFVLWREEWDKRKRYSVELLGLCYVGSETDTSLATKLLSAMVSRLCTGVGDVTTELSERAKQSEISYWKALGFTGIPGSKTLTWSYG